MKYFLPIIYSQYICTYKGLWLLGRLSKNFPRILKMQASQTHIRHLILFFFFFLKSEFNSSPRKNICRVYGDM